MDFADKVRSYESQRQPARSVPGRFASIARSYRGGVAGTGVREQGHAYGAGVRLGAAPGRSFTNLAVSLEYGRAERSGRQPGEDRFTVSVGLQF